MDTLSGGMLRIRSKNGLSSTNDDAFASVKVPDVFAKMTKTLKVPAEVIEGALLEANPGLKRDQITVTCKEGFIQEVRVCLTKDLTPRRCGADVIRDCTLKDAVLGAVRCSGRRPQPPSTRSTILPIWPLLSMRACAFAASIRGNSLSITGRSAPRAISGQTWVSRSRA